MIKKFLIISLLTVSILYSFLIPAFSASNGMDSLNTIELKLFNHNYLKETPQKRLNRIENSIFGRTYNQSVDTRIARINNLFASLAKKQLPLENSQIINAQIKSATDYPAVTQLELRVFQQGFVKEDVTQRLSRLESKVFGTTFPNDNLADRLDRLKSAISKENEAPYADDSDEIIIPDDSSSSYLQGNLSALETNILGQTYENDQMNQRLNRLEIKAFGATQPGTTDSRLSKLNSIVENSSVVQASGSNQNDFIANSMRNNVLSQNTGWDNSFFDDQSQSNSQKSGFVNFLENLAIPVLSAFLNRNNSYTAYPNAYYGYPPTYPYHYRHHNPYQYSVPYIPGYWNSAYNNNYSQGTNLQTQELLNSNYGIGVHILPY